MFLFLFSAIWVLCLIKPYRLINADTECPTVAFASDRRSDKTKLRIVQYNIEWMFIDYYAAADCPGNGCSWVNQSEVETHVNAVSKVINDLNPDIINFCEIEGCDELKILKTHLNDESYMPYLKKGTDTATGQNVGMLTRIDPLISLYRTETKHDYPIQGNTCGNTNVNGTSGVSKHYITEFQFGSYNVALIAAHLLAIPTEPARCVQREAQASVLQSIIYSYIHDKKYEVIMLGDLNDYDAEILDLNNNKPTSRVLEILKGKQGTYSGQYELQSVAETIPQTERYSEWYDSDNNCNTMSSKDFSMIDHILVTPKIKSKITNAFIYHEYAEYCGKYNSDHFPVVIDLIF